MAEYGIKRKFKRSFPYARQVEDCQVFVKLKEEMATGDVFAAIRENCVDFYYKGQRAARRGMRTYRTSFSNECGEVSFNKEYDNNGDSYIETILAKCEEHSKGEGLQLSKAFSYFSWACHSRKPSDPILLDVEARFAHLTEQKNFDKIDYVFLLPELKALLFVEGKRQRDSRVRSSSKDVPPEVFEQIGRYERQIVAREEDGKQITKAYTDAIEHIKEVFGVELPIPEIVLPKVPILIVGEDEPEKDIMPGANVADVWLEVKLEEICASDGITGEIEYDNLRDGKALLIDGREIFRNHKTQMAQLGDALNALANDIISNA